MNFDEPARKRTKELSGSEAYWRSWRERKKVEVLFAELKNVIKLRRFRLRRLWNVAEQTLMAATAQNIRRLIHFLATPATEPAVAASQSPAYLPSHRFTSHGATALFCRFVKVRNQ